MKEGYLESEEGHDWLAECVSHHCLPFSAVCSCSQPVTHLLCYAILYVLAESSAIVMSLLPRSLVRSSAFHVFIQLLLSFLPPCPAYSLLATPLCLPPIRIATYACCDHVLA